ncbi:MAG: glycoside hydrolase [Ruminococcus sp.]|nr:glycoside hydrolase [Ruminococcus sp.]
MYSKILRKAGAAALAAAMALNTALVSSVTVTAADAAKYEFEDATVTGATAVDTDSSASGGSILYMKDDGTIEMTFTVESAGIYDITIYAHGVGGSKQQDFYINGASQGSLSIPKSDSYEPIKSSVKLAAGENTLKITSSWGWTMFDYFTVESAVLPDIKAAETTPCDPEATAEAASLMDYLAEMYGNHIISGQQEIYNYGPHGLEQEFEYLKENTGHYPAIRGFDYGNFCCPAFGSDDGSTERVISWVKDKGGIATASFHINVPNDIDSYTIGDRIDWAQTSYTAKDNNFSPSNAYTEGTKEYEYYRQSLTTLAAEFKKLEAEGIPVIWRPLHEAEGGGGETGSWFWWGKEGSAVYKQLWIYTYKTLTEDFDCHNLIWEWNSYNFDTSANWYPGDEYVDIIGYDKYNCTDWSTGSAVLQHNDSAIASTFYGIMERYNSAKMVSMAENDCFSTVSNLTEDKAGWLYFCTWYDGGSDNNNFLTNPVFNTLEDTIEMYQSDYCITLDELPADLYTRNVDTTATTRQTTVTTTADPTTTTTTAAFVFEVVKKSVTLPEGDKTGCTLEFTIEGAPGASIGGALGYGTTAADWTNVEWSGNADADGTLTYTIELDEVPADFTSAELQVWWSNVWDAANEVGIDQPCEIVECKVNSAAATTTESSVTTTTTTTAAVSGKYLAGDANESGEVNMADAVAIMRSQADPDNYSLTAQGRINADVIGNDGVTNNDALAIQQYEAGIYTELPVESAERPVETAVSA